MSQLIKKLSVLTLVLFATSLLLYLNETRVNYDLGKGSEFIKGFNPAQANKIMIKKTDGKTMTLRREEKNYVMAEHYNYPADNEKINVLLFNIADIKVEKKISKNKSDFEKYELTNEKPSIEVVVYNSEEAPILQFFVGKSKGAGHYVRLKNKEDIYLTQNSLTFSTSVDAYIKKTIPLKKTQDIENINAELQGEKIEIVKKEDDFEITKPKKKSKLKKEDIKNFVSQLNNISFQDFKPINNEDSAGLQFTNHLTIMDKNKIITQIELANSDKKYFIKLSSSIKEAPKEIALKQNESDEKLKSIDDMIKAQQSAQNFNLKHSGWIYEVTESTFNKLTTIK